MRQGKDPGYRWETVEVESDGKAYRFYRRASQSGDVLSHYQSFSAHMDAVHYFAAIEAALIGGKVLLVPSRPV